MGPVVEWALIRIYIIVVVMSLVTNTEATLYRHNQQETIFLLD